MARKDRRGRNLRVGESQRADGRYEYRYIDPKMNKRVSIYNTDLAVLREMEKELQREIDDGILTTSEMKKMDVNTLFERYLSIRKIGDATRRNYISAWDNHVRDGLGQMRVVNVRPSHIKVLYCGMSKAGYSKSTIKFIHDLIYPAFGMAVADDIIRKNPAMDTMKDYGEAPKVRQALTSEQQDNLLRFVTESNSYRCYLPLLQIMIGTALRCGELIGLTWNDVDMEKNEINIDHQLIYKNYGDGYKFHYSTPKTEAGIRTIPMTDFVKKAFQEQKKHQFLIGVDRSIEVEGLSDFVFTGRNGLPMMPSAVNNVLYNIVAAYNRNEAGEAKKYHRKPELIPKFSAHVLRHTGCTRMAERGIDLKVLQYIMGHANVAVTMDVYNHIASKQRVENEIKKINDLIAI